MVKILDSTKSAVIQAWLRGKTRKEIASEFDIGTGSVTNIIDELRDRIGSYQEASLRELGVGLKKAEISPNQCGAGLRVLNLLNTLGIKEDDLTLFLNKIYMAFKEQGLQPENTVKLVKIINAFTDLNHVNQIPKHIKTKSREKIKLDIELYHIQKEINNLNKEIEDKKKEINDLENDFEFFKQKIRNEQKEFQLFKSYKNELEKNLIPIENIQAIKDIIRIFRDDFRYDPITILCQFSCFEDYEFRRNNMKTEINELEKRINYLETDGTKYEEILRVNRLKISELYHLKKMGFDLPELKKISNTFKELSTEYNIDEKNGRDLFFKYLRKFGDKIYFDIEIAESKNILENLDKEISSKRKNITAQPNVSVLLEHLVRLGISEDQFLNMVYVFKKSFLNNRSLNNENVENIVIDIQKYGTINNSVKKLEDKRSELQYQIKTFHNKYYLEFLSVFMINYIFIKLLMKEYTQKLNTSYLIIHIPNNSKIKDTNKLDKNQAKERNDDKLNFSIHHDAKLSDQDIIKYLK
ncbi:MAG: hypothetical protein ACPKPY_05600 [Nitrososphaeraceae archaeon]